MKINGQTQEINNLKFQDFSQKINSKNPKGNRYGDCKLKIIINQIIVHYSNQRLTIPKNKLKRLSSINRDIELFPKKENFYKHCNTINSDININIKTRKTKQIKNSNKTKINCSVRDSLLFRSISKELTNDFNRSLQGKSLLIYNNNNDNKNNLLKLDSLEIYKLFRDKQKKESKKSEPLTRGEEDFAEQDNYMINNENKNNINEEKTLFYKSLNGKKIFDRNRNNKIFKDDLQAQKRLKDPNVKNILKNKIEKYKKIFVLIDRINLGYISIKNIRLSSLDNEELILISPILVELHKKYKTIEFKEFCIKIDRYLTNQTND